jgi:hypothetical protein
MKPNRVRALVSIVTLASALGTVACDKGPMEKAGEKVDKALDQDKIIGKGPMQKAGEKVDNAADKAGDKVDRAIDPAKK